MSQSLTTAAAQTYRLWGEQPGAGALPRAKLLDLSVTAAGVAT